MESIAALKYVENQLVGRDNLCCTSRKGARSAERVGYRRHLVRVRMRTPRNSYCPRRNVLPEMPRRMIMEKERRVPGEMWSNMAAASGNGLVWVPSAWRNWARRGMWRKIEGPECGEEGQWAEPGKSRRCFPCVGTPMRDDLFVCFSHAFVIYFQRAVSLASTCLQES